MSKATALNTTRINKEQQHQQDNKMQQRATIINKSNKNQQRATTRQELTKSNNTNSVRSRERHAQTIFGAMLHYV